MRGSEKVGVLLDPRKSDIERISVMVSQTRNKSPMKYKITTKQRGSIESRE